MVLVIKIVSKKSLGVKLKFDISIELSTKKLLEKLRGISFGNNRNSFRNWD